MYEHKTFLITSLTCLISIAVNSFFYFKYQQDINIALPLKLIPIWLLIGNVIVYLVIYRLNIYALSVFISLLFCMIGDILLSLYISIENKLVLITGGICFSIARLLTSSSLFLHPYYNNGGFVSITIRKIILNSVVPLIFLISFVTIFSFYIKDNMILTMISFYILVMSLELFSSIIRIFGFEGESPISQFLGFFSVVCFNVSDILLIHNMFTTPWEYEDKISICFYWLSLFLLVISIVRNKNFNIEKGNYLYAHTLLN